MAARELSKFEQDTLVEALTQIDAASKAQKLAEHAAAIEVERAGRIAAEARIGELTAELTKRQTGYQVALTDMDTKLEQAREARGTADLLAAQAKAEAAVSNGLVEKMAGDMAELRKTCDAMMEQMQAMQVDEPESPQDAPISYRLNVVGRDATGDLRTVEIIPIERI